MPIEKVYRAVKLLEEDWRSSLSHASEVNNEHINYRASGYLGKTIYYRLKESGIHKVGH